MEKFFKPINAIIEYFETITQPVEQPYVEQPRVEKLPIFRLPSQQEYIYNPNQRSTFLSIFINNPLSLLCLLFFLYKLIYIIYHLLFVPISEDGTGYDSKTSELKAGLYGLFVFIINLFSIPILIVLMCFIFCIYSGYTTSSSGGNFRTNENGFKNFNIQSTMVIVVPMVVLIIFLYYINIK